MTLTSASPLQKLQIESLKGQIRLMRSAVEDATYELWEGRLSYGAAEALSTEIRRVKNQIAALERSLLGGA